MESANFITALAGAQKAGITKDDFLRIWNMEAQLRLLRGAENSKRFEQQNSVTQWMISNRLNGNHEQPENFIQEVKNRPGLPEVEVKEDSKDLAKDIPQTDGGTVTSVNVNAPLVIETCNLKENFDDMRKEFADEMHQVKEELKKLKDELPARCQENVRDKLCPQISEQKQELAGLREDVKQSKKEFLELKEIILAVNKKFEESNGDNVGFLNALVDQKLNGSCFAVDAETQTCHRSSDDNNEEDRKSSKGKTELGVVEKSGNLEKIQKENLAQVNNGSKLQPPQDKELKLEQPQMTQGDGSDLQKQQPVKEAQQETQQKDQEQELAQDCNVQKQHGKNNPCQQQQQHYQTQDQGPEKERARLHPQQKDRKKPQSNTRARKPSLYSEMKIFPRNGTIFEVKDVKQRLTEREHSIFSPVYRLPNSSKTVSLGVWFSDDRKLNVLLLVFGLDEQSAKDNEVYFVSGQIKHDGSGEYTWLFEGKKRIWKYEGPNLIMYTSVCLKTAKRHFKDVSLDELEKRQYISDNSLVIRWFVRCNKRVH